MSVLKLNQIQTANGVIMANLNSSGANVGIQLASNLAPAFSAYSGTSQNISNSTYTKIALNNETFDTANCFDSTTNYRFTPNVAGYYQINAAIFFAADAYLGYIIPTIYKNGSIYKRTVAFYNNTFGNGGCAVCDVIYMNGTTDYIEFYVRQTNNSSATIGYEGQSNYTYMSGALVRSA